MKRKMTALVIGNAAYKSGGTLKNPVNDANDMADKLKRYGFDTIEVHDATYLEMDKALKEFKKKLENNDVGMFFFAGHGVQIEGSNYLIATDSDNSGETEAKHSSLPLDRVIETMDKSDASTRIVILDACRNNPWERAWKRSAATRGLAAVYAPKGTIIGYATSPGETALDGSGRNGTYTAAILQHIDQPDCTIETMFKQVRNTVAAETQGKQTSWEHTSLSGNFIFNISLGNLVTEYDGSALADRLFVIDDSVPSHRTIKNLKSLNWYKQNPAIEALDAAVVKKMERNNLFVLGRNIYQSACGGANSAVSFIENFMEKTGKYHRAKRKALLDGMLFEIFFDSEGKLRPTIKGSGFSDLFELYRHKGLRESFDFISETLVAAQADFFALPGRGHALSAAVTTKKVKDRYRVKEVYVGAENVLRSESEDHDDDDDILYVKSRPDDFVAQLAIDLVVPEYLLKVKFTHPEASESILEVPHGYTVRKQ